MARVPLDFVVNAKGTAPSFFGGMEKQLQGLNRQAEGFGKLLRIGGTLPILDQFADGLNAIPHIADEFGKKMKLGMSATESFAESVKENAGVFGKLVGGWRNFTNWAADSIDGGDRRGIRSGAEDARKKELQAAIDRQNQRNHLELLRSEETLKRLSADARRVGRDDQLDAIADPLEKAKRGEFNKLQDKLESIISREDRERPLIRGEEALREFDATIRELKAAAERDFVRGTQDVVKDFAAKAKAELDAANADRAESRISFIDAARGLWEQVQDATGPQFAFPAGLPQTVESPFGTGAVEAFQEQLEFDRMSAERDQQKIELLKSLDKGIQELIEKTPTFVRASLGGW